MSPKCLPFLSEFQVNNASCPLICPVSRSVLYKCSNLTRGQKKNKWHPNNNCENKRATELVESQGQLQSLIKQGIMGLYGDYHYRPLHESSTIIFLSPWAHARWFSTDYTWTQDMRPHSLNKFFSLTLFNKDWFSKREAHTPLQNTPWTYKVEYVHIPRIPLLVFMRMCTSICPVNLPWQHLRLASAVHISLSKVTSVLQGGERRGGGWRVEGGVGSRGDECSRGVLSQPATKEFSWKKCLSLVFPSHFVLLCETFSEVHVLYVLLQTCLKNELAVSGHFGVSVISTVCHH